MDLLQQTPIASFQIKPVLASRDFWTGDTLYRGPKTAKIYSKSLRTISILQADLEIENKEVSRKRALKAFRSNKYLSLLHVKETFENTTQLPILGEILRRFNHLQKFKLEYIHRSSRQEASPFFSLFKYLENVNTLELDLDFGSRNSQISLNKLRKLTFRLRNLERLVSLTLIFSSNEKIHTRDLTSFSKNLKKCQRLKNLALKCWASGRIQKEIALNLASCINSLKNLSSLTLNLRYCPKIDPVDFFILLGALRMHSSLKSLCFCLSEYQDIEDGVKLLSQELIHFQSLRSLKFYFVYSTYNLSEDFFKNISKGFQSQSQLQILSISLNRTKIQGPWAKYLAEGFKALQSLSKFSFTLRYCESLNDSIAGDLGGAIGSLTHLLTLELNFYENNFSQAGIRRLLEGIRPLKTLLELNLDLNNRDSTIFLLQQVKSFLPFYKSQEISTLNSILGSLFHHLQVLKLSLILFNSAALDLSPFSRHLASMNQLTTLHLGFDKVNSSITLQEGLQDIFFSFKQLEKLVDLSVSICNGSDQDLQALFACLKDLKNLNSLGICFQNLHRFTFKTAYQFIEATENLQKLSELRLYIDFPRNVGKEVLLFLSSIPKLKSLTLLQEDLGRIREVLPPTTTLEVCKYMKALKGWLV